MIKNLGVAEYLSFGVPCTQVYGVAFVYYIYNQLWDSRFGPFHTRLNVYLSLWEIQSDEGHPTLFSNE